eukprot:3506-Chlamydomonas_euryale.AAC.4
MAGQCWLSASARRWFRIHAVVGTCVGKLAVAIKCAGISRQRQVREGVLPQQAGRSCQCSSRTNGLGCRKPQQPTLTVMPLTPVIPFDGPQVPWNKLGQAPVIVEFDRLYILAGPKVSTMPCGDPLGG